MAIDWRRELGVLSVELQAVLRHQSQRDHYHHAIVHVGGELTPDIELHRPRIYASGHRVARNYVVALPKGGFHIHYFMDGNIDDSNHEPLDVFKGMVSRIRRVLKTLPAKLAPQIAIPPQANGADENMLSWLYLLHWLGNQSHNRVFRTHVEFAQSISSYSYRDQYQPWEQCSSLPDFDPVELLTLSGRQGEDDGVWRSRHVAHGKVLPEMIASSLSKPLFYASINAASMLGAMPLPEKRHRRPENQTEEVRSDLRNLRDMLIRHHCRSDGVTNWEAMTLDQIASSLSWQQSRATRRMQAMFPDYRGKKGHKAYQVLCLQYEIEKELHKRIESELNIKVLDDEEDQSPGDAECRDDE
jgi:hypothetical protein